jgi:hypothetical protein
VDPVDPDPVPDPDPEHCKIVNVVLSGLPVLTGSRARICRPFKEPKNPFPTWRVGTTTLFDVPARQVTVHRLAESIPWNRFLGSLNVYQHAGSDPASESRPWILYMAWTGFGTKGH